MLQQGQQQQGSQQMRPQGQQMLQQGQQQQGYQEIPQGQPPQQQGGINLRNPDIQVVTGGQPRVEAPVAVVPQVIFVHYGLDSFKTKCGHCGHHAGTRLERQMNGTMCCLIVLCVLFCWSIIGCILLCILCANVNNYEYIHFCSGCGRELGRRQGE